MKIIVGILTLLFLGISWGQTTAMDNPTLILVDTLAFAFLLFAAFFAWELYKLMKGGEMAKSWGFIAAGIIIFALDKAIEIGNSVGFWEMLPWLPSAALCIVSLSFLLGIISQRKVLK